LQKWPFAGLIHGDHVVPLNPLDSSPPILDESGSLSMPLTVEGLAALRAAGPPSPAGEASNGPAALQGLPTLPAARDAYEMAEDADNEELPPGQDPVIIG